MKRLLPLLLILAMLLSLAAPAVAFATEQESTTPAYPDLTEAEYNGLYVTEGLVFMLDFYKANEYWNTEDIDYTVPIGPSDNSAYLYKGQTYDLTTEKGSSCWRVIIKRSYKQNNADKTSYTFYEPTAAVLYNGISTPTTEYAAKADAVAAAAVAKEAIDAAIDAHNAGLGEGATKVNKAEYSCEAYYCGNNALIQAHKEWLAADKAYLAQFINPIYLPTVDAEGEPTTTLSPITIASYNPAIAAAGNTYYLSTHATTVYSPFVMQNGYLQMREHYNSSGGIVFGSVFNDAVYSQNMSMQFITAIANQKAAKSPVLYGDTRLVLEPRAGQLYATKFSSTTFSLPADTAFPTQTAPLYLDQIIDLTYTVTSTAPATTAVASTFTLRTHTDTVLSVDGTYKKNNTTYYGWSESATNSKLYAVRNYNAALTSADLLQNHLADLCKFFRLDISPLMSGEVGERVLSIAPAVLATIAGHMSLYTMADEREVVAAALAEAIDTVTLTGEGAAFEAFCAAINNGTIDATQLYALPDEYHGRVFDAYKAFLDANPTADAAAHQTAVDNAVTAVLTDTNLPFADYYGNTIVLTADAFFAENPATTPASTHFAALAAAVGLDMAPIAAISPAIREYVYEEFVDYSTVLFHHAAILQAAIAESTARIAEHYFGEGTIGEVISFEGFQFRLTGATAYRAVYAIDTDALAILEDHGFAVTITVSHKVKNTADDPVVKEFYRTGMEGEPEFLTIDGKTCIVYEFYTNEGAKIGQYSATIRIEREGNTPLELNVDAKSKNFPEGAKLKTLADLLADNGVVTTNVQRFLEYRKVIYPTIFIDGQNLSDFRVLVENETAAVRKIYLDALEAATRIKYATITAADAEGITEGLVRFEKGDAPAIELRDGNVVFTYTDDLNATKAAFAAALAKPEDGYPTFAYEDEEPMPVCLLCKYHDLTPAEE